MNAYNKMSCDNTQCKKQIFSKNTCDFCSIARYCSPDCTREDWYKGHMYLCPSKGPWSLEDFVLDSSSTLGKGLLGKVKPIIHKKSGKPFALKEMSKYSIEEKSMMAEVKREISVHQELNHPAIIRLYEHFQDGENLYMVLEYAPNDSLFQLLKTTKKFDEPTAWTFFSQTCNGLFYLHSKKIVHRDLKPENLLLDKNNNVKISDFGWCAQGDGERQSFCGTLDYMAPEILSSTGHSYQVDLWALGVLLYELLHGRPPFGALKQADTLLLIQKLNYKIDSSISVEASDLIQRLLQKDPEDRISLLDVFRHPWITKYSPPIELSIGQQIEHADFGPGVVIDLEGLLCTFQMEDRTEMFPVSEVYMNFDILPRRPSISPRDNHFLKEEKVLSKLERIWSGPLEIDIEEEPVVETFYVDDYHDTASGLLDTVEIKTLEEKRFTRNLLCSSRGNPVCLKPDLKPLKQLKSSAPLIDTSDAVLKLREKELIELSNILQGREQRPDRGQEMKPRVKEKHSFFAGLFDCTGR